MSEEKTYWGILCRTCSEPVAFNTRPYHEFGLGSADIRPGTIRCGHGHNHIYFPRDFHFFASAVPITEETMQENRAVYIAINPSPQSSFDAARALLPGGPSALKETIEAAVLPSGLLDPKEDKTGSNTHAPDTPREIANKAAKIRWASWARQKVM
jgi:hypothetical protein